MSEKEKGKSHPFAGYLRETEEVLWMMVKPETSFRDRMRVFLIGYGLTMVLTILIVFIPPKDPARSADMPALLVQTEGFLLLLIAPITIGIWLYSAFKQTYQPDKAYAITNERLLYRSTYDVMSLSLENVPPMTLLTNQHGRGTLSFGALFPLWGHLENAAQTKDLIETAQKNRLKELQS